LARLFDHLVGTEQKRFWNCEAERLCGLEVDYELGWLEDRKVGRLGSRNDLASIDANLMAMSALRLKADISSRM
jgi:hypothetical protein